jgi:hypothetical protein
VRNRDAGHSTRTYISILREASLYVSLSTLSETGDIIAVMAADIRRTRAAGSSVGYAITLVGAALFVATCFLPYYGFPGGGSVSLYDQLMVGQDGGLEFGAILVLFGGVATIVVVAMVGLARGKINTGCVHFFLAGAVAAWSLTWIGSLLQTASLRNGLTIPRLSLEMGFWLQAISIGVVIIGTILVATRRMGAHERGAPVTRRGVEPPP